MPGTSVSAVVTAAVHLPWHVDPRGSEYRPTPLDWSGVRVTLDGATAYVMDPAKAIDILITTEELAAFATLATVFGQTTDEIWATRKGIVSE